MAYITEYIQVLSSIQRQLKEEKRICTAAALSHPEVLSSYNTLHENDIFVKPSFTLNNEQSKYMCNYHRLKYDEGDSYVDIHGLWEAFDWNVDTFDVKSLNGYEKEVDLGNELPNQFKHRYDVVIDNGVLEHIFNIGQAILNSILMLKSNSYITFYGPLNQPNHGFWNASPTVFIDIFRHYGFEKLFFQGMRMNIDKDGFLTSATYFPLQETIAGQVYEGECNYMIVAKSPPDHVERCGKMSSLNQKFPTQSKYLSILS